MVLNSQLKGLADKVELLKSTSMLIKLKITPLSPSILAFGCGFSLKLLTNFLKVNLR